MSHNKEVNETRTNILNDIKDVYSQFRLYVPIMVVVVYILLINFNIKQTYYTFKMYIPMLTLVYYVYFLEKEHDDPNKIITTIITFLVATFTLMGLVGKTVSIPLEDVLGFKWQYFAYFEWMAYISVAYFLGLKIFRNEVYALNYLAHSVSAGGWLYEIPFFHFDGRTGLYSVHIANVQVFSLFILVFMLYHHKFKPNKVIFASSILFIINLMIGIYDFKIFKALIVYQRIPTMIMLISFLTGIPKAPSNERCQHMTQDGIFVIDKSGVLIRGTGCTKEMVGLKSPRECNGVFCRLENKMLIPIPTATEVEK